MKLSTAWNESPGFVMLLIGWVCFVLAIASSMLGVEWLSGLCFLTAPYSWLTGFVCGLCIRQNSYGKIANWLNGFSILAVVLVVYLIWLLLAYGIE